ncbi:MAG: hypothetical protein E8D52_17770 [Nitrospira sp.]|nr:MAG: hypothetical protein E8D52_17770 [Nitrospira sp.]
MSQLIPERYAGLIGLGLMYLWGATLLVWVGWIQSYGILEKIVGVTGVALASLSGIATFLYVNGLESEVKDLRAKNSFNEAQAKEWKDQAQLAISLLEKERSKSAPGF